MPASSATLQVPPALAGDGKYLFAYFDGASEARLRVRVDQRGTADGGGIVVATSDRKTRLTRAMIRDLARCVDGDSVRLRSGRALAARGYVELDTLGRSNRSPTGAGPSGRSRWRPTDKGREIIVFLRSLDRPDLMPEVERWLPKKEGASGEAGEVAKGVPAARPCEGVAAAWPRDPSASGAAALLGDKKP